MVAENVLIVGYSQGNAPDDIDTVYNNARGFIASRTDGFKVSGVSFHNYGEKMTPLQSCSECFHYKLWVTGGKTTYFENISSSVLVFGLASVNIFQLILTELRSEMLTSRMEAGHGSANW